MGLDFIGVGAQSTLGGSKTFLPENICIKINKMPEFYMIFARKINKMPEFYTIFARKKFLLEFGICPPPPPSPTPMLDFMTDRLNSSHATKQQIYCFKSLNVILMKHQSLKYTTESCTGWA